MVAHLLRLKLTLLRNSVRRSPWQLVGLGIGILLALLHIRVVRLARAIHRSRIDRIGL